MEALKLDTTALNNFSSDYSLFKSQILALNNNGDTSTSSETNNPGFSKTQAGVQAQQLKLGVSDNYMRKQYEAWWSDNCETMLNMHFANKHGMEEIELDADTARKVREIDPTLVTEENKYVIDYDEYTERLEFTVDASTSDKESDEKQMENIDTILQRIESSPMLQQIMGLYPEKQAELYNKVISLSGVEGADDLMVDAEQFAEQMNQQQMMAEQQAMQAPIDPMSQDEMPMEDPSIIEGEVVPEQQEAPIEGPPFTDEEMELIQGLGARGIPDELIEQAVVMMRQGMQDEEILQVITQAMQPQEAVYG